jgi:hypothetical protein
MVLVVSASVKIVCVVVETSVVVPMAPANTVTVVVAVSDNEMVTSWTSRTVRTVVVVEVDVDSL